MKNIFQIITFLSIIACSSPEDDCADKKNEINETFDAQVEWVINNPGPNGIDYDQLYALEAERNLRLEQACD